MLKTVFGLDIGTRSVVGVVGHREGDRFVVQALELREHETRAMLDGQIHDIAKVAGTVTLVKEALEQTLGGQKLESVCIAAAGRVLQTVSVRTDRDYDGERTVTEDDVFTLCAQGVEQAYERFLTENQSELTFYCVGYSVTRYYMNGYEIGNPVDHKARTIGADLIATFLPEDVVDGLYKAVELAGLKVASLTLEPIAAMQVAIPERFRLLNLALVDVGAGTSDIAVTRDGTVIAYGMIPIAGDSLTETIARDCLTDFNTAEAVKLAQGSHAEETEYIDVMGIRKVVSDEHIAKLLEPKVKAMTRPVADKITELNGGQPVSAVFVVGGGGKIAGYTKRLAAMLDLPLERVAIRGEDVMGNITLPAGVEPSPLLVTPIGICLNFYEQSNDFVFVNFNGESLKVYDNGKLTVLDAAMQAQFPNDALFPKRGAALVYTVDGQKRTTLGEPGESAVITVNAEPADISTPIKAKDYIKVEPSTAGAPGHKTLGELAEFHTSITVQVQGNRVTLPKYASVGGALESQYYEIAPDDVIVMQPYYRVAQVLEFMDVNLPAGEYIAVNNAPADLDTPVYDNFTLIWGEAAQSIVRAHDEEAIARRNADERAAEAEAARRARIEAAVTPIGAPGPIDIYIIVNEEAVKLTGKSEYVYVDAFDAAGFDTAKRMGTGVYTSLNGRKAQYMEPLHEGDILEIYWVDKDGNRVLEASQ